MKFKQRMISLLLAVLLAVNSIPVGHASRGEELTIKGDLSDAVTDMVYGWNGGIYQFPASVLEGVEEGDQVYLVAKATVEGMTELPKAGTEVLVKFSDFEIGGEDAEYYLAPDLSELPFEKTISILPKTLLIRPAMTEVFYGQRLPQNGRVTVSDDYKKQLVRENDDVTISCNFTFKLNDATAVGTYPLDKVGRIQVEGEDAQNYEVVVENEENLVFSIVPYETDAVASDGDAEGNQNGKEKATLKAPEGFQISLTGSLTDEGWGDSVEIELQESMEADQKNTAEYYLRNNTRQSEAYRAICKKTYTYSAVPLPVVTGIEIAAGTYEEINGDLTTTTMLFEKDAVFANGNVQVVVYVRGAAYEQETEIVLSVNGVEMVKIADEVSLEDGRYTYKATFDIPAVDGESVFHELKAYARNSSGTGENYPAENCQDTYMGKKTLVTKPLVLDRKGPTVEITGIDIEYWMLRIAGNFTVYDDHVGVDTVKYAWDSSEYKEYSGYHSDETDYTSYLSFFNAERVPGGLHTLRLLVTDALGNTTEAYLKDTNGVDELDPEIVSVEIQPSEGAMLQNTSDGIFAKGAVTIVVRAKDMSDEVNATTNLGENSVKILVGDNREYWMTRASVSEDNVEHVYTLVIDPNQQDVKWKNVRIRVNDNAENEIVRNLMETTQPDGVSKYLSNDLYVENDKPSITISGLGIYDNDVYWVGAADVSKTFNILVTDMFGQAYSGLKSVKVTKSKDNVTSTVSNWSTGLLEIDKCTPAGINVSSWEDGTWTITVEAVDICGNTETKSLTFNKDVKAPESGKIDLKVDDQDVIHDVKKLGDADWFAPEISEEADKDGYISFRIGSNSADEKLREIIVKINGGEPRTFTYNDGKGWYEDENGGSYIYANTKTWVKNGLQPKAPTEDIPYNHYIVKATLVDKFQNPVDLPTRIVYVDKVNPKIEKVTVQKAKESLVDQIIRILSFGIFSNDDLIFSVYTYDGVGDSGMKRADMTVTDRDTGKAIVRSSESGSVDEDGFTVYSFTVSKGELKKFDSSLAFTVYDRYGKDCTKYPYIDVNENFEVMIERELPSITFNLPEATGFYQDREDGQKWYNADMPLMLQVCDTHSGIYSITLLVNGRKVALFGSPTGIVKEQLFAFEKEAGTEENRFDQYFTLYNLEKIVNDDAVPGENGEYRLAIKVADNSGNVYAEELVYYIDTVKPTVDKVSFSTATADGIQEITGDGILSAEASVQYSYFFKENFDITVHVSDPGPSSGLHHVDYWFHSAGGEAKTAEIREGKATIDVDDNFKGMIYYRVWDAAGNCSDVMTTNAFVVDSAAPTIDIQYDDVTTSHKDGEGNPLCTKTKTFTVTITDSVSGLNQFSYLKNAELHPAGLSEITIDKNSAYEVNGELPNGWKITEMDANLVTKVTKTFSFADDDNSIQMFFSAMDQSKRKVENVASTVFTIDTKAPQILVDFGSDNDDDPYYNQNRIATITITERNFSESLIRMMIENRFGNVPGYTFKHDTNDNTKHTAIINFDEGDYTFGVEGEDLGGHKAVVTYVGGNEKLFYVDKTKPLISENFYEFANENENSFNVDKTAKITIVEHNFDPGLTNLRITRKAAGGEHSINGMVDVTDEILGGRKWNKSGDAYTIEFTFSEDAVYYVEIAPVDLASNHGEKHSTVVFEIDKTVPVVSAKNGEAVTPDNTELLDIYPYDRKGSPAPTVEFSDNNIVRIEYTLTRYVPKYLKDGLTEINAVTESGVVEGNLFVLEDFDSDGIYAVELVAIDVAGNRSETNFNTYARMVGQDVLAFILDSNVKEQTGLFSLEYENGDAISKKPDDFKDLRILVMAPVETPIDIVVRDTNGKETLADVLLASTETVYGVNVYIYELSAAFFQENFQDDIDIEMQLTIRNRGNRIDLARIHIDSIAPDCRIPEELHAWARFHGTEDRTFTITNISELLVEGDCKVYDNGEEVPFEYNSEDDSITFTLSKGWHNVGVILCDAAGNAYVCYEMNNIHIGNFWIIFGVTVACTAVTGLIVLVLYRRKRALREMQEEA